LYRSKECIDKCDNDDLDNNNYNNDASIVTSGTDADRERTDCVPARISLLERSVTGYWLVLLAMGTSLQFRHL
jgi:hypothetical protein